MKAIDINAALEAQKQIHATTSALQSRRADLDAKRAELDKQNAAIYRAPLLSTEVKAIIFAQVDRLAAAYARGARWEQMFADFVHPKGLRPKMEGAVDLDKSYKTSAPINLQDLGARTSPEMIGMDIFQGSEELQNFFRASTPAAELERACFFFGDIIKAKLSEHFDRYVRQLSASKPNGAKDAPSLAGPTIEQRRVVIAENDTRIQNLSNEIADLDRQLALLRGASNAEAVTA